jgi:hypothetical protein
LRENTTIYIKKSSYKDERRLKERKSIGSMYKDELLPIIEHCRMKVVFQRLKTRTNT